MPPGLFQKYFEISDLATDKVHDETAGRGICSLQERFNSLSQKILYRKLWLPDEFTDSEIVASILNKEGFGATRNVEEADLILVNTCSIREKAEQTVRKRLTEFQKN